MESEIVVGYSVSELNDYVYYSAVFAGNLYFIQNDVLWISGGKPGNTKPVTDAGLNNAQINAVFADSSHLYVSGYTYQYGLELYVSIPSVSKLDTTSSESSLSNSLVTRLYPNPAGEITTLSLSGRNTLMSVRLADNCGKVVFQHSYHNVNKISINTASLIPGVYFMTIKSGHHTQRLKLLKQ